MKRPQAFISEEAHELLMEVSKISGESAYQFLNQLIKTYARSLAINIVQKRGEQLTKIGKKELSNETH
jgi:hypothetical protein